MLNRTAVVCVVVAAGAAVQADIVEMSPAEGGQDMHMLSESDGLAPESEGMSLSGTTAHFSVDLDANALMESEIPMLLSVAEFMDVPEIPTMRAPRAFSLESVLTAAGLGSFERADSDPAGMTTRVAVLGAVSAYDSLGKRSGFGVGEGWFDVVGPGQAPMAGSTLAQSDSIFMAGDSGGRFGGMDIAQSAGLGQDRPTAVMADRAIPAPGSAAAFGMGVLMAFGWRRR